MLIRSQDKKITMNINQISAIEIQKCARINGNINKILVSSLDNCYNLAMYEKEETAIKVLGKLMDTYSDYTLVLGGFQTTYQPSIFDMPEDNEVEE